MFLKHRRHLTLGEFWETYHKSKRKKVNNFKANKRRRYAKVQKQRCFLSTKLGETTKVSKQKGAHEEKIRISFKKTNGHTA